MPISSTKIHICDCEYCEKKSCCLICGTRDRLHRAHIIPQHIISAIREENSEKYDWLSFQGDNIFILCYVHHRQFDSFILKEKQTLTPYIKDRIGKFVEYTKDKTVEKQGIEKFNKWTEKMNNWLFDGIRVISWEYERV